MYVQRNIVARSRITVATESNSAFSVYCSGTCHCHQYKNTGSAPCKRNNALHLCSWATSLTNNIELLSVTIETQQWVSLPLSSSYIIFRNAVKIITVLSSQCKVPDIFFNEMCTFRTDFNKVLQHEISWKSIHYEASWYMRTDGRTGGREDRQTDMTKLIGAFRDYANVHKNGFVYSTEIQKIHTVHYIHNWGFGYDGLIAWMVYH